MGGDDDDSGTRDVATSRPSVRRKLSGKQEADVSALEASTIERLSDPVVPLAKVLRSHIARRLASYAMQDRRRRGVTAEIHVDDVIKKLVDARGACHYCGQRMKLASVVARDLQQWSLDRLDNSQPHTDANTVVSCLGCNLRKRRRNPEQFKLGASLKVKQVRDGSSLNAQIATSVNVGDSCARAQDCRPGLVLDTDHGSPRKLDGVLPRQEGADANASDSERRIANIPTRRRLVCNKLCEKELHSD